MREGGPGCVKDVKGRNLLEEMKSATGVDEEMPEKWEENSKNVIQWKSREDNAFRPESGQLCRMLLREPVR